MAGFPIAFHKFLHFIYLLYVSIVRWKGWNASWWALMLLVISITFYALCLPSTNLSPVKVTDLKHHTSLYGMMPFYANSPSNHLVYEYSFVFTKNAFHPERYRIIPDDCLLSLTINEKPVDLSFISSKAQCDPANGFVLDLSPYLHNGRNTITARVEDIYGFSYGLHFSPHYFLISNPWFWNAAFNILIMLIAARCLFNSTLRQNPVFILCSMCLLSIAVRLPAFFISASNESHFVHVTWDESTYINMGQYILNGNLPYTTLWDNKPPLLFYIFALLIKICGQSVSAIRLIGALVIGITGSLCLELVTKLCNRKAGWFVGAFYIIYSSADSWTYSVLSDHLACPPIIIAFLITLLAHRSSWLNSTIIGLLVGIAAMIQTNYWAYAFCFAFMQIIWLTPITGRNICRFAWNGFLIGLFSALPFLTFWFLFAAHGQAELFWRSLVTAELGHVGIDIHQGLLSIIADKTGVALSLWYTRFTSPVFLPFALYLFFLLILFSPFCPFQFTRRNKILLYTFFAGSILAAGMRATLLNLPTQTLGMVLSASIAAGILASYIITWRNILAIFIMLFSVHFSLQTSYPLYMDMFTKLAHKEPLEDDIYYHMAATINNAPQQHTYIFTCETEQTLYFLTQSAIPLRIAHPHIIPWGFLPDMAYGHKVTIEDMFNEVKSHRPTYIVAPAKHWCFETFGKNYMNDYRLLYQIDNEQLWQITQ